MVFGYPANAQDNSSQKIILQVGQTKEITTTAQSVFSSDDTILKVERTAVDRFLLTGLMAGDTQLVFSDGGTFQYSHVHVDAMESASSQMLSPQFNNGLPYMQYTFVNTSTFTRDTAFQNPNYTHRTMINGPYAGGNFQTSATYLQNTERLSNLSVNAYSKGINFLFGKLDTPLTLLGGAVALQPQGWGTRMRINKPFIPRNNLKWMDTLTTFAGLANTPDVNSMNFSQKKVGFTYAATATRQTVYPDLFNMGFMAYQSPTSDKYAYVGTLEGMTNVSPKWQIGGGAYASDTKVSGAAQTAFTTPLTVSRLQYLYTPANYKLLDGTLTSSNIHSYNLYAQKILKDRDIILNASANHQFNDDPTAAANSISASLGVSKQYSIAKRMSLQYGFSSTSGGSIPQPTWGNNLTASASHPLTRRSYIQHSLSASNSDSSSGNLTQAQINEQIHFETGHFREDFSLGVVGIHNGSQSNQLSITANNNMSLYTRRSIFQFTMSYSKTDVNDELHGLNSSLSITYQPTSTYLLVATSSLGTTINNGLITYNGSNTISVQAFWGPGVVRDSLIKKVFTTLKGKNTSIGGRVFMDINYNDRFEAGDVGLENLEILLDGKRKLFTGPGGMFTFSSVAPGSHTIEIPPSGVHNINSTITQKIYVDAEDRKKSFLVPVQAPKATIIAQTVNDSNESGTVDEEDVLGENRYDLTGSFDTHRTAKGDNAMFKGLDPGTYTVSIDPTQMNENMEPVGPTSQTVVVTDYKEYVVKFLFKPIRSIRGQVVITATGNNRAIPGGLMIRIGTTTSPVDRKGYYWLRDFSQGQQTLEILNLPRSWCAPKLPISFNFSGGYVSNDYPIEITRECNLASKSPN